MLELPDDVPEQDTDEDQLTADDVSGVVTYTLDWSVHSLLERIGESLDINPSFQRRDAWSADRKTRYIESLMLGLPVPQVVLAESSERRGEFLVLDGKQRLITMKQFAAPDERFPPLRLGKLEFLPELSGKRFSDLEGSANGREYAAGLLTQPVRTVVVRNWRKPEILYQIFVRLNQNSVPLSPQELRQALYAGAFTTWINERSAKSDLIHRARRLKGQDFRMRDAEMLLRSISFQWRLEDYAGNLRQFLDESCQQGNNSWSTERARFEVHARSVEAAITRTFRIFEEANSFLRYEAGEYLPRFNIAVFDLMTAVYSAAEIDDDQVSGAAAELRTAFEQLCARDKTFERSITSTTKTREATLGRIVTYGEEVQRALGQQLEIVARAASTISK
jgi:hypothetical protein